MANIAINPDLLTLLKVMKASNELRTYTDVITMCIACCLDGEYIEKSKGRLIKKVDIQKALF